MPNTQLFAFSSVFVAIVSLCVSVVAGCSDEDDSGGNQGDSSLPTDGGSSSDAGSDTPKTDGGADSSVSVDAGMPAEADAGDDVEDMDASVDASLPVLEPGGNISIYRIGGLAYGGATLYSSVVIPPGHTVEPSVTQDLVPLGPPRTTDRCVATSSTPLPPDPVVYTNAAVGPQVFTRFAGVEIAMDRYEEANGPEYLFSDDSLAPWAGGPFSFLIPGEGAIPRTEYVDAISMHAESDFDFTLGVTEYTEGTDLPATWGPGGAHDVQLFIAWLTDAPPFYTFTCDCELVDDGSFDIPADPCFANRPADATSVLIGSAQEFGRDVEFNGRFVRLVAALQFEAELPVVAP